MKGFSILIYLKTLMLAGIVSGYSFQSLFPGNQWINCTHDRTLDLDVSDMNIYFYDFENDYSAIFPIGTAVDSITTYPHWDPKRSLAVFFPGFKSDVEGITAIWVRDAYKKIQPEVFFIIVEFSAYTGKRLTNEGAEKSTPYSYFIGREAGEFISELHKNGVSSEHIHLSGHSLGGNLVAFAGEEYIKQTSEKIKKVTSLDPNKPCFDGARPEDRIRPGIAEFVEVFHCSEKFSFQEVLGDADFYYNKELSAQPGCYDNYDVPTVGPVSADQCGHIFCVKYWADSMGSPKLYQACSSYEEYVKNRCVGSATETAGYYSAQTTRGTFYASTVDNNRSNVSDEF